MRRMDTALNDPNSGGSNPQWQAAGDGAAWQNQTARQMHDDAGEITEPIIDDLLIESEDPSMLVAAGSAGINVWI